MACVTVYSVSDLNCPHKDLHWTGVIKVFNVGTCNKNWLKDDQLDSLKDSKQNQPKNVRGTVSKAETKW